jgi:hypothetical protein
MEYPSFSQEYGCSKRQELSRLLENQKGDDNYKAPHI